MAMATERKVQQQLKAQVPIENILNDWLEDFSYHTPKEEDCISFFHLAYNSGHWKLLMSALPRFFENRWAIHWGILLEITTQSQLFAEEEIVQSVLKGARKQNLVELLVLSHSWDTQVPEISSFRQSVFEKIEDKARNLKETLWEKLGFLRTQRMVEEEGKLLHKMQRMYPEDKVITSELEEFKDRWARHFLSARSERKSVRWSEHTVTALNEDEKTWIDTLVEDMKKHISKNPSAAYNFAMGLQFMGLHQEALSILLLHPDTPEKNWLRIELLLKARRFVEVLSLSQELEAKYADDPETTFATYYIRALSLKGLGQTSQAIELLRSLISIRPSYRSAQSLLSEWTEDGE